MNQFLTQINSSIYEPNGLLISNYRPEKESQEYGACRFEIDGLKIISRNAKITPKKVGQFVTVWKRSAEGITIPFDETDDFDVLVVHVQKSNIVGQFVFSKSVLKDNGIITSEVKSGKRGFRVYPPWDKPINAQAIKSQKWQIKYFCTEDSSTDEIAKLYLKH